MVADLGIKKVKDFCNINIDEVIGLKESNEKFLAGVGRKTLEKQIIRANILSNIKKPIIHKAIELPEVSVELFFDIEADPTQNLIYLHGVYERRVGKEKFIYFLAKDNTEEEEKRAWQEFWDYIKTLPKNDYAVYYYSPYEKTAYKKMRK
ncbi:ribonuclease H-like domain-containing protein [Patescibacteria group bacterium]|nr:ribonuclease H-like domain-containing protein [Patescibacteria group bacterium]MBU4455598.1 ribonuclease H-like domain-containing protein [Patescibacteria group bacterium]